MKICDTIVPELKFEIVESEGEVDGVNILGKLKGEFFVPNGTSRNKRFYPQSLWEKAISNEDVQNRMRDRRMFGTVSHNCPINDDAIREGKISHVITDLRIENGKGIGEAIILATPTGQTLNTMLRAGCKLFVSSRADGEYKGKTAEGLPIVDENSYVLYGFDIVSEPGFLEANPKLVENCDEGEFNMDLKEVLESVSKENAKLKNDLESTLKENETLKNTTKILTEENKHVLSKNDKLENVTRKLGRYETLGTVEEINKCLEKLQGFLNIGTIEECQKAIDSAGSLIEQYKKLGTPAQVEEAIERAESVILEYKKLGTLPELSKLMETFGKQISQSKLEKAKEEIKKLAEECQVSEDSIRKLYGKVPADTIRETFGKKIDKNSRFIKKGKEESKKPKFMDQDSSSRLMESLCR